MTETVELPATCRACPQCGGAMKAERATLGAGWGGGGVRYLYRCPSCGHGVLLENDRSLTQTAIAGGLLAVVGLALLVLMNPPGNVMLGVLVTGMGGAGIWSGLRVNFVYPRQGAMGCAPAKVVPVEDQLFPSEAEAARSRRREEISRKVIYGIVAVTLLVLLYEGLAG